MNDNTENLKIIIGKELRNYRIANKLTLKEVAQPLQYTISALSHIERGIRMPSPGKLKALADFYGVSVEDFLQSDKYTNDEKRRMRLFRKMIDESKISEKSKYFDTIMQLVDLTENE